MFNPWNIHAICGYDKLFSWITYQGEDFGRGFLWTRKFLREDPYGFRQALMLKDRLRISYTALFGLLLLSGVIWMYKRLRGDCFLCGLNVRNVPFKHLRSRVDRGPNSRRKRKVREGHKWEPFPDRRELRKVAFSISIVSSTSYFGYLSCQSVWWVNEIVKQIPQYEWSTWIRQTDRKTDGHDVNVVIILTDHSSLTSQL